MFNGVGQPTAPQEAVLDVLHLTPSGFGNNRTKYIIIMFLNCPIQGPLVGGHRNATECLLRDDMFNTIPVLVVLDIKGNGTIADSSTIDLADALHPQYPINIIT